MSAPAGTPSLHAPADVTGFMIVRDVVANGYPFLEAIFGSLALCRTIHVLDGESGDGTWPALLALRDLVGGGRIVLVRERWRERRGEHPLATATNQLRRALPTAPGRWLWSVQANEIVGPETAAEMRGLLRQHREIDLFRLPFTTWMGLHYRAYTDYRGRLFRNLPELNAIGDAYDCGFDTHGLLKRPWRAGLFLRLRRRWVTGHLAHPVLRLRAPFPENYPVKLTTRAHLNPWDRGAPEEAAAARRALDDARAARESTAEFWARIPFARESDASPFGPIPPERRVDEVPPLLAHLRDAWRYDPDASLAALARLPRPTPP